jgi:hypothetical protein
METYLYLVCDCKNRLSCINCFKCLIDIGICRPFDNEEKALNHIMCMKKKYPSFASHLIKIPFNEGINFGYYKSS